MIFIIFLKIFERNEDRGNVSKVLVLISDGQSSDHNRAVDEAQRMKNSGILVLCVGIGRGRVLEHLIEQLKQLVSRPEYVLKSAIDGLQTTEDSLVKYMCDAAGK